MNIAFVCTGNTCRSPMASALFKMKDTKGHNVISRGLSLSEDMPASENAVSVMGEMDIDISSHRSRQLTYLDIEESDLILTMGTLHKSIVLNMSPESKAKIFTIYEYAEGSEKEVADPFMQGIDIYRKCRDELDGLTGEIAKKLEG